MFDPNLQSLTIRVPATSANLGPGFDCIGLAVDLWNETTITPGHRSVFISGEGEDSLPTDSTNLVAYSADYTFRYLGVEHMPLSFVCRNHIPLARGLGSSSAATITGIAAAFTFAGHDIEEIDVRREVFSIAAGIEGHPDNVAPAVFGGCQIGISINDGDEKTNWITSRIAVDEQLKAVVFIPNFTMKTEEARGILPTDISRADAVFNIGRAAMLVHAISTRDWSLLRHATDDRLHQPQRIEAMFPMFRPIARGAMDAGAHSVFLSGAGPTIMALATDRFMTICYEMSENARKAQIEGRVLVVDISQGGIQIHREDKTEQ